MFTLNPASNPTTTYEPTSGAHWSTSDLKFAQMFGLNLSYLPLHIPTSTDVIALDVAPIKCDVCGQMRTPSQLSNYEGWFTNCCHVECSQCYETPAKTEICEECGAGECCCSCIVCDWCDSKNCDCTDCRSCGSTAVPSWSTSCANCGYCNCEDCLTEREGSYSSLVPGWIRRGDEMDEGMFGVSSADRYIVKETAKTIDPPAVMAAFYLTDYIGAMSSALPTFAQEAKSAQDGIVATCADVFRSYAIGAIGGELRHHSSVNFPDSRSTSWDYFGALAKQVGADVALADAVELFDDTGWPSSGYGGQAWATCARVVHAYETGKLDPRTFVDRVFTLQHNGGSFLNKVSWSCEVSGRDPGYCISIGAAHSAMEPDLCTLLESAGEEMRELFFQFRSAYLDHVRRFNRDNRHLGMVTVPAEMLKVRTGDSL